MILAWTAWPVQKPIAADELLLEYIRHVRPGCTRLDEGQSALENLHCMVLWARPSKAILSIIKEIQEELLQLMGNDFYSVPESDMHLSVLELSHRHSVPCLHEVLNEISRDRLQIMLDLIYTKMPMPLLETPQLSFDNRGIAITFLPAAGEDYTYHHLRVDLQSILLESGMGVDTCYTAPSAHVSLGRFIGTSSLQDPQSMKSLVNTIQDINARLQEKHIAWRVGEEKPLELQMGYVRYGKPTCEAEMIGRPRHGH